MNASSNAPSMCDPHDELAMHVRTDVRTNAEAWLRTRDNSPSVTRAHTYDDSHFAQCLEEAAFALKTATTRMGTPRIGEQRQEIHPWTRRAIYWRDGSRCAWCHRTSSEAGNLVLDHIKPWADGGSDHSDNLRTLCAPCNDGRSNFATDAYTRVTPVGMCDRCWSRPTWSNEEFDFVPLHELDPDSTFRLAIFCGRCGNVDVTTDEGRVL